MNSQLEENTIDGPDISIIIPAYNEEDFIGKTLKRIYQLLPQTLKAEVIVVDNCSDDNTGKIIQSFNCRYLSMDKKSNPSKVRNFGANLAKGKVFVFLDADILITKTWLDELTTELPALLSNNLTLTGAQCSISEVPGWLEKNWFIQLENKEPNYINGSNIIIHNENFKLLGGFDENLDAGEDVDFSKRARLCELNVVNNPKYLVHHEGYPKTIHDFIRREMWHGSSDFKSLKRFFSSKTAIAGCLLLLLLLLDIVALIFMPLLFGCLFFLAVVLFCMFIVYMKFGVLEKQTFLINTFICFFYLLGRALSPLRLLR